MLNPTEAHAAVDGNADGRTAEQMLEELQLLARERPAELLSIASEVRAKLLSEATPLPKSAEAILDDQPAAGKGKRTVTPEPPVVVKQARIKEVEMEVYLSACRWVGGGAGRKKAEGGDRGGERG